MRLTNIRISGFKSFVDKTEITLSEKRTGIIGPNGCGKSNIIDAVKWVLGETSKHIRGDSIDDVIFNGTDSRKPNDYANVELIFSNIENRIGGQYAQYDEISVKREVTRDGASKYFLNNSHCRRRDILDIFMGTGLGPKSYAIINQGTASRLIESKPEEFRVYLEEVAGISKYRERKRETENKISHTKDNLERLNDVISEVTKQIKTLERQAIQADKFKKLSEEKKSIKSEILAISIRDFQENIENKNKKIESKKTKLIKKQSEINSINTKIEKLKINYQSINEEMNETQKQYYDALSEVGRTEQAIEYEKDGVQRNKHQYEDALKSIEKIRKRLSADNDELTNLKNEIGNLDTKKSECKNKTDKLEKDKNLIEEFLKKTHAFKVEIQSPQRGKKLELINSALKNAEENLNRKIYEKSSNQKHLINIQNIFHFKKKIKKIEVYDNSHHQGKSPIGAMIAFNEDGFLKSLYRKYNINSEHKNKKSSLISGFVNNNDYLMMKEVIERRFIGKTSSNYPDLLIIDGGKGHLNTVLSVLKKMKIDDMEVLAISKGINRDAGRENFYTTYNDKIIFQKDDPTLFFLQKLRDEVHRYAIAGHRLKSKKTMFQNPLDEIEGIGAKRKKSLLDEFGSAKAVGTANLKDLLKVEGINKSTAQKVFNFFN